MATARDEEGARAAATTGPYCVIGKDAFDGLKPDLFVVVAGASSNRKRAQAVLQRARKTHKDAYVKPAGQMCGGSGAPISPALRAAFLEADRSVETRVPSDDSVESKCPYWKFYAEFEGTSPAWATVYFHQGHDMSKEYFFFEKGKVVGAAAHQWFDADTPGHFVSGPGKGFRYYFIGDACYRQVALEDSGGAVCPQECAPGVRAKIVARAEQVLTAARARGAALEEIADKLDGWPESLYRFHD